GGQRERGDRGLEDGVHGVPGVKAGGIPLRRLLHDCKMTGAWMLHDACMTTPPSARGSDLGRDAFQPGPRSSSSRPRSLPQAMPIHRMERVPGPALEAMAGGMRIVTNQS